MMGQTLVAGIGNIFFGDDAFGVEVVRRLEKCRLPKNVHIAEFGIRGVDFAFSLTSGVYDNVLLVDTVKRGGAPGTLYLITPKIESQQDGDDSGLIAQTHSLDPWAVLRWAETMGTRFRSLRLVGCEPEDLGSEEELRIGLSPGVHAAVDEAVKLILETVNDARDESNG